MDFLPTFQLIQTDSNDFIFADVVKLPDKAAEMRPFVHFHPQVELVWFRRVSGSLTLRNGSFPLADGQAVFLPSMEVHSFMTGIDQRDWILLLFEPQLLEPLIYQFAFPAMLRPVILTPQPKVAARLDFLCDWLASIAKLPDRAVEARQVLHLVLVLIATSMGEATDLLHEAGPPSGPVQTILGLIHADPREAPSLTQAAAASNLSESYFSRLFKLRVGMGYAAYVQMHRLNVAARLLVTGTEQISQISYVVGFATAAHFSTVFAERFGLSPRSYRQRAIDDTGIEQKNESE